MTEIPTINRRTYVGSLITAAAVAAGAPAATSSAGDEDNDDQPEHSEVSGDIPVAHPFIGDLDGDDLSGDMEFDVRNRYAGDPAVVYGDADEDDRDWVLHYTTDSKETQDYPAAMINLRERLDTEVKLDELKKGTLTFDFFVGKKHDQYIPGQVYLVVQTDKQKDDDKAWGIYKNVRKGGPRKEWETLDVVDEMSSDGTDAPWRALEIDVDPDGFRASFDTFSDAILEQAIQTRDEEGATFDDVFKKYDGDAKLLAMGLGSGSSRSATARDIYFDEFTLGLDEKDDDYTFDLPAVLQMDGEFDSRGQITATLEFDVDPEDVDLDDLDEDSVRLYPFSQIMPPLDEGVAPNQIDVDGNEIEVRFPPGRVRGLDRVGGGEQRVVVAGEFDYEHVVWFFAVGEVEVPGN